MEHAALAYFLFEDERPETVEEAMAISGGGAGLATSGQISGGPMLPVGMKKRGKKKNSGLLSASPKVHNPDALSLKEMPHVEYDEYGPIDFKFELLPLTTRQKKLLMLAFYNRGVLCRNEAGDWLLCTPDKATRATDKEIYDPNLPHLPITLKRNGITTESFGAMHKPDFKGEAMPGLWKGLEDPDDPTKTLLVADDEDDKLY